MTMNPKRQYFHDLALQWDSFLTVADAPARIRRYLERSARRGARRILDVGCGTGILLPYLLEMYPQAAPVVEFDFAEGMLAENARKFPDQRILRVCADAQDLPFVGLSFDLILCFSVLPHLGDTAPAVEKLYQALRPQGVLTVGHMSASKELNEFHRSLDAPVMRDKLLSAGELGEILRRLGAAVVCMEEETDWYFVRAEKGSA
jgi:demethylmenaquinone methyltransferase/2-methoxy-6-polyprenyl-1,4-benzoquinol methylase